MNVRELQERFPSDGAFIDFWIESRFGGDVPCRHCGSIAVTRIDVKKFRCRDCGRKFSILKGTIFENTKQPIYNWLYALAKVTENARKGISSHELARDLGIQQATAWNMLHKIRLAMADANESMEKLAFIVEADECFIGGKPRKFNCKWKHGGEKPKVPVMVMVERPADSRPGRARAIVPKQDHRGRRPTQSKTTEMILDNVDIGRSEVHTDESHLYKELDRFGILHESVLHQKRYVDRTGHIHINTSESFHAILKRMHNGVYHKMKRVGEYADEAAYRWSHRRDEPLFALDRILRLATVNGKRKKPEQWPPKMEQDDGQLMLFE